MWLLVFVGAFGAAGCAPLFPQEMMDRVDHHLSFKELQTDPEKFKGIWVMQAGIIISSKNTKEGLLIEVLQTLMDDSGSPQATDTSAGRFLVQSDQFLDSAIYHRGRSITVIGEVIGKKTLLLDNIFYPYPLLAAKALHLWQPSSGPRFFFGVGVSGRM